MADGRHNNIYKDNTMNSGEREFEARITNHLVLPGILAIPRGAKSLVIFSHGSGSSRFSTRNSFVARQLNRRKIATLLIDLLTPDEDSVFDNRFNISLLTERLISITKYVLLRPELKNFQAGYFGASTGAASAIHAAARLAPGIKAVVSRGGRPDLAEASLASVQCAVLLLVGSLDTDVLDLNREAYDKLHCIKKLQIIDGASHLFEEGDTLKQVAIAAGDWFVHHFKHTNSLIPFQ